jgi:CPA2 family monovalent cation:H+ antiporter-2
MSAIRPCPELANVPLVPMPPGGCIDCLAVGDTWVHLRYCVECGETRCCDSSKNRHARAHWTETHHPVVRSKESGEAWAYCYPHDGTVGLPVSA